MEDRDRTYLEEEEQPVMTFDEEVDDTGVTIDMNEEGIGLSDNGDTEEFNEDDYKTIKVNNNFINRNGDIVVMDTSDMGNTFDIKNIDINNIIIPKRIRSSQNVDDLVQSIRSTGMLEPISVAPTATDGIYVLLHGMRRLIACAKAGIRYVPSIVNSRVSTTETMIVEALYNHHKNYTVKEEIDYIEYMENEKNIIGPTMFEYLLQWKSGDYTKLKDILEDDDDEIVSKLLNGQFTIDQAFKALEKRRKAESKDEQEIKKANKVYGDAAASGVDAVAGSGDTGDAEFALTDEEIKAISMNAGELNDGLDEKSLEEMMAEGNSIDGYQPHKQDPNNRERLDPALRKAVLARDENTCQICKAISGQEYTEVLDVHHVNMVAIGGSDDIDNLITACTVCHKLVHLYSRGELHIRPMEEMDAAEREKFKRIVKLGNVIRKGMAARGIKREEIRKMDKAGTIGRTLRGSRDQVAD